MKTLVRLLIIACVISCAPSCRKNETTSAEQARVGVSALPHAKQYSSELANEWFRLLANVSRTAPLPPPPSIRLFAYSEIALYEAVVPGMPSYQSIYTHLTGDEIGANKKKDYHWGAAANAAVARTAARILKSYNPNPNLAAINALEAKYYDEFKGQASEEDLERSVAFGRMVADKIYAWSMQDGTFTPAGTPAPCPTYVPLGGPGNWVPTPPNFSPAAGACQGKLRTFNAGIQVATRPAPPPAYSTDPSSPFFLMVKDVVDRSNARTADEAVLCQSWRDIVGTNFNTPAHVLNITTFIMEAKAPDLEDAAVIYAKQGMAVFDAIVSAFDAKFYYSLLRPITYVRGPMANNTWNPLYITIIHPSYPATMPSASAAGFRILEQAFGGNVEFTDNSLSNLYGSRNYSSFAEVIQDVGKTRVVSGHNFQISVDAGIMQGKKVADITNALPFRK